MSTHSYSLQYLISISINILNNFFSAGIAGYNRLYAVPMTPLVAKSSQASLNIFGEPSEHLPNGA